LLPWSKFDQKRKGSAIKKHPAQSKSSPLRFYKAAHAIFSPRRFSRKHLNENDDVAGSGVLMTGFCMAQFLSSFLSANLTMR